MSGQFSMCGWAYDDSVVSSVQVTVDGVVGRTADYGQPRPDVAYRGIALRGIAPGVATRQRAVNPRRSQAIGVEDVQSPRPATAAVLPTAELMAEA
jgi:hypothetical protein